MMKKNPCRRVHLLYAVLFLGFGVLLFLFIQKLLCPKYAISTVGEGMMTKVNEIYDTHDNTYDVVFMGTSHVVCGVSPMEIYQQNKIKSYNFAISAQPTVLSYYVLQDVINIKNPKLVVYDASGLFVNSGNPVPWRYVIDNLSYGRSKYVFADAYAQNVGEEAFWGAMFPLIDSHTRWKELTLADFKLKELEGGEDFLKGYEICSGVRSAAVTVEDMNAINLEIKNKVEERTVFGAEKESVQNNNDIDCINEKNREMLKQMKQLCDKNGIEFLVIKIPAVSDPVGYKTWTLDRYYQTKEICKEFEIEYWDLMYESDVGIDWTQDSHDGGYHLNIKGAEKVSRKIADKIAENYILDQNTSEKYEQDVCLYQKLKYIALLESQNSILEYLQQVESRKQDLIVMLAVNSNCQNCVCDIEQQKLLEMGFKTEIANLDKKSYLAVMDAGILSYEVYSNVEERYQYQDAENGIEIVSSGYLSSPASSIKINNIEYALNWPGVNIVVFDKSIGMVIDSMTINEGAIYRDTSRDLEFLKMCRLYYLSI